MATKEVITKRLDVDPEVIAKAKVAYAIQTKGDAPENLENVYFREMLDCAVGQFLPQICAALRQIGLERRPVEQRQRPVSITTWDSLDAVVSEFDISKIQIVRCALQLMARSQGDEESDALPPEPSPTEGADVPAHEE